MPASQGEENRFDGTESNCVALYFEFYFGFLLIGNAWYHLNNLDVLFIQTKSEEEFIGYWSY